MVIRGNVNKPIVSGGKTSGAEIIRSKKISSDTITGDTISSDVIISDDINSEIVRGETHLGELLSGSSPIIRSEVIEEAAKGSPVTGNLEVLEDSVPEGVKAPSKIPIESIPEEIRGLWTGNAPEPKADVDYSKLIKHLGIGSGAILGSLAAYGLVKGVKKIKAKNKAK